MKNNRCLNDGYVSIYKDPVKRGSFGAKTNVESLKDLEFIVKLAYKEMNQRVQDLELLEMQGKTLSLKIKTHLFPAVESSHKVVLNNVLYDISYIDYDKINREMYLYCEKVKEL